MSTVVFNFQTDPGGFVARISVNIYVTANISMMILVINQLNAQNLVL